MAILLSNKVYGIVLIVLAVEPSVLPNIRNRVLEV